MSNEERRTRLRDAVEEETPRDGIHNDAVRAWVGESNDVELVPRYLACTSEGSGESSYRDNPDFFAGEIGEIEDYLAGSFNEGWATNWVLDLDTGERLRWGVTVTVA